MFFLVIRNSSNKRRIGGAALIRGRRLLTFLCQMRRLIEGGAYSSKYLILENWSLRRPGRLQEAPNTGICLEIFGILENWSLRRPGRLQEVPNTGICLEIFGILENWSIRPRGGRYRRFDCI